MVDKIVQNMPIKELLPNWPYISEPAFVGANLSLDPKTAILKKVTLLHRRISITIDIKGGSCLMHASFADKELQKRVFDVLVLAEGKTIHEAGEVKG